jgi:serine/threonine protein kinase
MLENRWVYIGFIAQGGCGKGICNSLFLFFFFFFSIFCVVFNFVAVFKAVDVKTFNSVCVVKTLLDSDTKDELRHKAQFRKEAQALQILGSLHIPLHIPKLFYYQEDPPCLVEEYIPGFSLGGCEMDIHIYKYNLNFNNKYYTLK